jgi:hypothetical protein
MQLGGIFLIMSGIEAIISRNEAIINEIIGLSFGSIGIFS